MNRPDKYWKWALLTLIGFDVPFYTQENTMIEAPSHCPVCKADLHHHTAETKDNFEEWEYECRCILHRMADGKLDAYNVCGDATRLAVDKLNRAA